jgi:hypothetical protein
LAVAINTADHWSVIFGMVVLLVYVLLASASAVLVAIWASNLAILLWKHRHDLRKPARLRPWLNKLLRRAR